MIKLYKIIVSLITEYTINKVCKTPIFLKSYLKILTVIPIDNNLLYFPVTTNLVILSLHDGIFNKLSMHIIAYCLFNSFQNNLGGRIKMKKISSVKMNNLLFFLKNCETCSAFSLFISLNGCVFQTFSFPRFFLFLTFFQLR